MAGFRVIYANEFVPIAQESYRANCRPGTVVDGRDVKLVKGSEILAAGDLKVGELDLFDGSPPCQAFSTAGRREKGWGKDKVYEHGAEQKNEELFFDYVRLRDEMMPRAFVAENVSGMVKGTAKGFFIEIMRMLRKGYRVEARMLDAQWLGVPQQRQRIIIVGVREDLEIDPVFPRPLPYRYSVRDALPWLSDTRVVHSTSGQHKSQGDVTDRSSPTLTAHRSASLSVVHATGRKGQAPRDITDEPSPTITAGPPRAAEGGGPRNHFLVQNSNATHSRKGERRSLEEPSPTLLARRANVEIAYRGQQGGEKFGAYLVMREEIVGVGNNGGFGGGAMQSPDLPAPTIGAKPSSGNGRFPPSLIEVRKVRNDEVVGENVAASLEGYAVGDEWDKLNPGQQSERFFSLVRTDAEAPCPTITASGVGGDGHGAPGGVASVTHPTEKRKFTILEVKRLCSFPDDFELKGTYGQQWERLGNSVPPVMMSHVAAAIRDGVLIPARAAGKIGGPAPRSRDRSTSAKRRKGAARKPSSSAASRRPT